MWKQLVIALAIGLPLAGLGGATHGASCTASGNAPLVDLPEVKAGAGAINPDDVESWVVTLGAGTHYLVVDGAGDADVAVCKVGGAGHVCESINFFGVPDSCALGLAGAQSSGAPIVGPGTFRIDVLGCFSVNCGYQVEGPNAYAWVLAKAA